MSQFARSDVIAVLGPTNTGKTHLAVERLCGHSSGMIGFPLRLLAREVYERVVAIKGPKEVALITGEEKILPDGARWLLCTAESMPTDRDLAFVALDEAQLGADPERGHVFTDRLLHARGREETMILGSESLKPMIRSLIPKAEIIGRPRFSTLAYAGAKKLSRLPKRSVVVAFSAEEVYAVAEMLRRTRGGAAVVMGALSPRTRNAQVAMYQAGEVDYLVATDAIGMGLNMDVAHVAFASLQKFDGRRRRRLTLAEMAQIAGRAGRHQRDGTFGELALEGNEGRRFDPEEIMAIEEHRFPTLDHLFWRDGDPDMRSVDALIEALEARPSAQVLRAAPQAVDLAVLKRLAGEPWVRSRARGEGAVRRLWAACGLPDFRKTGVEPHSRLVSRVYGHLSEGGGHLPATWFADEIARLDNVQGDVETLADRIAAARTWAYIAHRADWLAEPGRWAERTRTLEEKLSDALHQRLTQRFVDRRTAVLMRDLGAKGHEALPVTIEADGGVLVGGEHIGHLEGFRFRVDHQARHGDMKRLMAAAERRLGGELSRRAAALAAAPDAEFTLATDAGRPVALFWRGDIVARLEKGRSLLQPHIRLYKALDPLPAEDRSAVIERLTAWIAGQAKRHLEPVTALAAAARDGRVPAAARALYASLADAGGIAARRDLDTTVAGLDRAMRQHAVRLGAKIGTLDIYCPALLKPEAARWRLALIAVGEGEPMPELPQPGAAVIATPGDPARFETAARAGYRPLGAQMLRIDLAERLARIAHDSRGSGENGSGESGSAEGGRGRAPFTPDPALATSLGLRPPSFAQLMLALGFRPADAADDGRTGPRWVWRGPQRERRREAKRPGNAFAALADWRAADGR